MARPLGPRAAPVESPYAGSYAILGSFLRNYEEEIIVDSDSQSAALPSSLGVDTATQDSAAFETQTSSQPGFGMDLDSREPSPQLKYVKKYMLLIEKVWKRQSKEIEIRLSDLSRWTSSSSTSNLFPNETSLLLLPSMIRENAMRYLTILEEIVDEILKEMTIENNQRIGLQQPAMRNGEANHVVNVGLDHGTVDGRASENDNMFLNETQTSETSQNRSSNPFLIARPNGNVDGGSVNAGVGFESDVVSGLLVTGAEGNANKVTSLLNRRYELHLIPSKDDMELEPLPLRQVKASSIGKLITVQGIITRITEVKPMLLVATYSCDTCGERAFQQVNNKVFMPLRDCKSQTCLRAPQPGKMRFHTRGSKFTKFQQIKLQELACHVPIGHIPRTMGVNMIGELTRKATPGDVVTVHAIFLPTANQGFKAITAGLVADTYLLAQGIEHHKKKYVNNNTGRANASGNKSVSNSSTLRSSSIDPSLSPILSSPDISSKIEAFLRDSEGTRYTRLAKSIAPEIFGHEDIKKALLLQMVGGVTRVMEDGMKIRGDINICLMGDPGVAKSQLLKSITTIAPRAVYTSGKGSTGVGLTAAIMRDPVTKEFTLEGGSLTIADMGICCIDEFDKMDDADRTAIHEVMEQQTISIAKAGITTTLNARTAVLAAANPAWGRYNTRRSPSENINLPASLLSRFDLMFLILDKHDSFKDRELAMHITHVHRYGSHPQLGFEPLDPQMMRAYIALAKQFTPYVPQDLSEYIVSSYCTLREDKEASHGEEFGYTTARTLLAILRLSQALARLRFSTSISKPDIDEAIRLMTKSKHSLQEERRSQTGGNSTSNFSGSSSNTNRPLDEISAVYNIIRQHALQKGSSQIMYDEIAPIVILKGFSQQLLDKVLDTYDALGGVWTVSANRRVITLVT